MIDIGLALDLLAAAVAERGDHFVYPPTGDTGQDCIWHPDDSSLSLVGHALSLAGVRPDALERLRWHSVRDLFERGWFPIPLTLGAAAVFDAAERSQDRGHAWGEAVRHARRAAVQYVTLLPDHALDTAITSTPRPAPRSHSVPRVPAASLNGPC